VPLAGGDVGVHDERPPPMGEIMAKKAGPKPSKKTAPRLRTPRSDLDRLPQFEPDHILRLDDTKEERVPLFSKNRARQIRNVLKSAMKGHVRKAQFLGEPTSLKRFVSNAMRAIAMYEHRSLRRHGLVLPGGAQVSYDRGRASKLVKEAHVALLTLQRALEPIVEGKQLDQYLENLFVAARKQHERQREEDEGAAGDADRKLSVGAVLEGLKLGDQYRAQFRARSPRKLQEHVRFLEPLLSLSLQRLEFQPGDYRKGAPRDP
jgi:hypothetical protein